MPNLEFTVAPEESGVRLDRALSRMLPDSSRTFLQKIIKDNCVMCDGKSVDVPRFPVRSGMKIVVNMPEATVSEIPAAEEFDFPILYEDEQMLVINKPAGVVVHPAAGNHEGTVLNALLGRYPQLAEGLAVNNRPGIVHRLDKDTSGCLVIAKTPEAQFHLGNAFANREVAKTYLTLVRGVLRRTQGEIVTLIGRHPVNRQKMAVVERNGKTAITSYTLLGSGAIGSVQFSLLAVKIATGRTHQIRVHMSHLGFPVLGDQIYGGTRSKVEFAERQLLHAWKIQLPHPGDGRKCSFKADIPEDFRKVLTFSGIEFENQFEFS